MLEGLQVFWASCETVLLIFLEIKWNSEQKSSKTDDDHVKDLLEKKNKELAEREKGTGNTLHFEPNERHVLI